MSRLPVIIGMGGINAAGRSAGFHSYKRMVADSLERSAMHSTWRDLAITMRLIDAEQELTDAVIEQVIAGTLIRRIDLFDPCAIKINSKVASIINDDQNLLKPMNASLSVTSAGCIPAGLDLSKLYPSRNHPRGLQLTVFAASDLMNSLGLSWQKMVEHISPDEISVYAGSGLGQIDDWSLGGLIGAPLKGKRTSSKMLPLSMPQMAGDFINSYIINGLGGTGSCIGACASFLYNLRQGVTDIQIGRSRISIVGIAEAPVTPSVIEGFRVMGALAEDHQLLKLDGYDVHANEVDNRRACRPFSTNVGFTIAESAQFVMLMDDELALELGLNILGAVPEVFINADGNKKSISAPGVGNYITMAKATALTRGLLGDEGLKQTYVQSHGTGTPQNRVTESHIFNQIAQAYGIDQWSVTSIKSYVGHSIGAAAGDQLSAALGVWHYGYIPGIKTIDHIADDVENSHLDILMRDKYVGEKGSEMQAVFINSKGFGGNNATAVVLSPQKTLDMLKKKHGASQLLTYRQNNEQVRINEQRHIEEHGRSTELIYQFGEQVIEADSVSISPDTIKFSCLKNSIHLPNGDQFKDYL